MQLVRTTSFFVSHSCLDVKALQPMATKFYICSRKTSISLRRAGICVLDRAPELRAQPQLPVHGGHDSAAFDSASSGVRLGSRCYRAIHCQSMCSAYAEVSVPRQCAVAHTPFPASAGPLPTITGGHPARIIAGIGIISAHGRQPRPQATQVARCAHTTGATFAAVPPFL